MLSARGHGLFRYGIPTGPDIILKTCHSLVPHQKQQMVNSLISSDYWLLLHLSWNFWASMEKTKIHDHLWAVQTEKKIKYFDMTTPSIPCEYLTHTSLYYQPLTHTHTHTHTRKRTNTHTYTHNTHTHTHTHIHTHTSSLPYAPLRPRRRAVGGAAFRVNFFHMTEWQRGSAR